MLNPCVPKSIRIIVCLPQACSGTHSKTRSAQAVSYNEELAQLVMND
jgi:hypothetical protein